MTVHACAPPLIKSVTPATIELAKRVIADEAGDPASSRDVAAGARRICEKLDEHLARLVGQAGIMTLLARSLTLTRATFPWMAGVGTASKDSRWDPLETCLAAQDEVTALEALQLFLALFISLLGRLMGDALVLRLVREIWPAEPGGRDMT